MERENTIYFLVVHRIKSTIFLEKRPQWKQIEIPGEYVTEDNIALEMEPGDVLFLTKLTKHCSLENQSDDIRWSFDLRYQPIGQPTGRETFPGFIARSAQDSSKELHDPIAWFQMWKTTRDSLARDEDPSYNRWDPHHALCA